MEQSLSRKSKMLLPRSLTSASGPKDRLHSTPTVQAKTVMMRTAVGRRMPFSSVR